MKDYIWYIHFRFIRRSSWDQRKNSPMGSQLRSSLEGYFKKELSELLEVPPKKISLQSPFSKYGLDSVSTVNLNVRIKANITDIPLATFIGFQTAQDLIEYLITYHKREVRSWYAKEV